MLQYIKNRIRWSLAEFLEPEINGLITGRLLLFHQRLADDGHIKLPIRRDSSLDHPRLAALPEENQPLEPKTKNHQPAGALP